MRGVRDSWLTADGRVKTAAAALRWRLFLAHLKPADPFT